MAVDQELSALASVASLLSTDIIYLVRDPGGVAEADHKVPVSVLDTRYPGAVTSVFGRAGVVVATSGDYSAGQISGLGTLATVNDAPSDGSQYARQNAAWAVVSSGTTLPVADTNTIIKGSADPTKLLRWEIDGFTAGATRVMTPPNQDATIAGLEVANIFTEEQSIQRNYSGAETGTLLEILSTWNTSGVAEGLSFIITNTASNANSLLFSMVAKVGATDIASFVQRANGRLEALSDSSSTTNDGRSGNNRLILVNSNATVNTYSSVIFADNRNTEAAWIAARHIDHTNDYADLIFGTRSADGAIVRLYITAAGSVGIGDKIITPAAKLEVTNTDAGTNAIINSAVFGHNSSGTPTTSFGTGLLIRGESSTTADQSMGRLTYEWTTATHASRAATGKLTAYSVATEVECIRWDSSGLVTMPTGLAISDGRLDLTRNLTGNSQQGIIANVRPSTFQSSRGVDAALSLLNGHTNTQAFATAAVAVIGRILMTATSSITNAILVSTDAQIPTNTTITNLYHIAPRNPTVITGTLTNQWGLNIPDMTAAATLNYAIQTGLGLVVFGDQTRVKQPSTTAAVPTLFLEQLDLSEEFVEFNGTVATGNPIEAVGAKTLTTTHFIRVSVNGSFVYIPCGTIA